MIKQIRIDNLAFGGSGIGRLEGKAVFVPYSAPGDLLRIRVVRQKKQFAEGEIVEVLEASPMRRTPPCGVFGQCGGCQWQHLPYAEQLSWKAEIYAQCLGRQAGVDRESIEPPIGAPAEWRYRSRVQFKCRQTRDGFVMGFYRRGSHFVIDVEACPIAGDGINRALSFFRRHLPGAPDPDKIPQVDIAEDDCGGLRAVVHYIGSDRSRLAAFLVPLVRHAGISLFLQSGRCETLYKVAGEDDLQIIPQFQPPLRLRYSAGGFAQVNLEQNRVLVKTVLDAAGLTGSERVLDLFCGMGNFTLPMALKAGKVVGVEDFSPSIGKARENALTNGIANARFMVRPAAEALLELAAAETFDLVVLDPPRSGAYDVVRQLVHSAPRRIVYVSCDPTTLARDIKPLLHNGYRLCSSQAIDLFPQTHHIESVTLLTRTGK